MEKKMERYQVVLQESEHDVLVGEGGQTLWDRRTVLDALFNNAFTVFVLLLRRYGGPHL